ncbi:MAG: ribonuclease E/G [Lachnospiraceae bacterium]|nr:ribonuclease E/G [Lachnospiraceae bacterium]
MESRRIITCVREGVLADALLEDGHLAELSLIPKKHASILGNIYTGRVKNIVKNIQAAFVEIEPGLLCYLPLEEVRSPIYTRPKKQERLAEGDELLVQVCREAVKTKAPSVTTNLNLTGKYLVLTTGNQVTGYSSRLKGEEKARLKGILEEWGRLPAGLIVRTNAGQAKETELWKECERLCETYRYLTEHAVHRTACSCVLESRPPYLTSILGSRSESLKEILTDDPKLYGQIRKFLMEEMPEDTEKLRFYEDTGLSLKALYRLEKGLNDALAARVWLKSGAYLVIEPTEALTVIDVNTGKYTGGRDKQETIRKINLEAAREIAGQLRLRNLSGIILVDFVDLDKKEAQEELLLYMRELLKRDSMKAAAVDMTALGLMEITRKKQKKTLAEQAKECGI